MEKEMKILVALNFIENADDLLNRALAVANKYDASVYLIHVIPDMPHISFYSDAYKLWEDFRNNAVKETIQQMTKYIDTLSGEFKEVQPIVEVGEPTETIIAVAKKLDADLIIVGAHSVAGIKHWMHHNIGEKVMRLSPIPVLSFSIE